MAGYCCVDLVGAYGVCCCVPGEDYCLGGLAGGEKYCLGCHREGASYAVVDFHVDGDVYRGASGVGYYYRHINQLAQGGCSGGQAESAEPYASQGQSHGQGDDRVVD